jgi:LysR family transcriptional regulator, cell division regulator
MLLEHVVYGEVDGAFVTEPFDYSELKTVYTIPEKVSFISPKNRPNKMQYEQTLLVNSNPNCIYRKNAYSFIKKEFLQLTYH